MRIVLPLPPTDNRRLGVFRGKLLSTKEYRQWTQKANIVWNGRYKVKKMDEPAFEKQVAYKYWLYLPNKRTDIGNYTKATKDFLKGRLYTDDKWVDMHLQLPVEIDKQNPRIEIEI